MKMCVVRKEKGGKRTNTRETTVHGMLGLEADEVCDAGRGLHVEEARRPVVRAREQQLRLERVELHSLHGRGVRVQCSARLCV